MTGSTTELDLCGLTCPLPVLHTRRALRRLAAGHRLVVRATDPLAGIDIPHFVRRAGHRLESSEIRDGVAIFVIIKGTDRPAAELSPT